MENRQRTWIWLGAAMSFVVGFLLIMTDSTGAGLFLVLLGIGSLADLDSRRPNMGWIQSWPRKVGTDRNTRVDRSPS